MNGMSGASSRASASADMPSNSGMEKSERMTSGANSSQRGGERLLGVDDAVRDAQAGALQLAHLELGVGGDVLGQQYADGRARQVTAVISRHPVGEQPVQADFATAR